MGFVKAFVAASADAFGAAKGTVRTQAGPEAATGTSAATSALSYTANSCHAYTTSGASS